MSNFLDSYYTPLAKSVQRLEDYYQKSFGTIQVTGPPVYVHLLPHLNDIILKCKEFGLYTKWEWDIFLLTNKVFDILEYLDNKLPQTKATVLTLAHVKGIFYLYCAGVIFSLIAFVLELKVAKIIDKRKNGGKSICQC